ncbi:MAG: hypothetical protein KME35_02590 [Aphanocapsa sp. GSE-SYN-MK-11-07L]|jgi:hypothetical protein|nr:hypothetical protein [Aphanocapsa sp. GSE-SYN-MK-11-07L]
MKVRLIVSLAIALLSLLIEPVRADSPITSTRFADAYQDDALIQAARKSGILDLKMAEYLSSPTNPIDQKAALINALSWKYEGKSNATLYRYFLSLTYGQKADQLDLQALTADEVFALGYLTVMDDYFNPEPAIALLLSAKARNQDSFTVVIVTALAQAQATRDWCQVWQTTDAVTQARSLKQDMRPPEQNELFWTTCALIRTIANNSPRLYRKNNFEKVKYFFKI